MQEFTGKTAVVTGGASGIGRGLAERFASEGMRVVIGDVEKGALDSTVEELRAGGAEVEGVLTDVSDREQMQALADAAVALFGGVHVFCNNAGVGGGGLSWEAPLSTWEWVLGVDLWGVIHGVRSFVPLLMQQAEAHIVNTASVAGLLSGVAFIGPYSATKVAVVSISETLGQEFALAGLPIGVSVLCPSGTETNVMESERNRPVTLGSEARTEMAESVRLSIREGFTGPEGQPPSRVARRVLEAVRAGEFWIVTHPFERPLVQTRFEGIMASYPTSR